MIQTTHIAFIIILGRIFKFRHKFISKVCHHTITMGHMEKMYATTKGPHQYSTAVGTIKLDVLF
jgi:hypothetical protein